MEKKRKEGEGACDHEGINWGFRDTFELGSSIKFKVLVDIVRTTHVCLFLVFYFCYQRMKVTFLGN